MPELVAECVAGARDDLGALVALVEAGLDVTRFAEKLLLEHDIIHPELDLAHGALETVLVPGQGLSAVGVHLDTSSPLNLYPASEAGWQMLGEEAVVAEEAPVLVVVLGVHQGGVTLTAHETFVMPVAFSVIDQVLDMNWKFAPLADLCNRFSLKIIAHCIPDTFFAFESILSEQKLALFVSQEKPASPAFKALLMKSLLFEQDALRDNLMANRTLLFKLIVITFFTSRLALDAVRRPLGQRLVAD